MTGKRRRFSEEFKIAAVKLVTERGLSISEASRDLGVHGNMLGRWKRDYEEGFLGNGAGKAELEELRSLKMKLRVITEERDILKKALAYFAEHQK